MEPYSLAYQLEEKKRDEENWISGMYFKSALTCVLDGFFSKNPKQKYIEKPFMQIVQENTGEIDIEYERQKYVDILKRRKKKFDDNHRKETTP